MHPVEPDTEPESPVAVQIRVLDMGNSVDRIVHVHRLFDLPNPHEDDVDFDREPSPRLRDAVVAGLMIAGVLVLPGLLRGKLRAVRPEMTDITAYL